MLYGSSVEGESDIIGYTYTMLSIKYTPKGKILNVDGLAGNYIFIADAAVDAWASTLDLEFGAEVTVLMHESGHSIGISKIGWAGAMYTGLILWEIYDSDSYSVMSYLSPVNAGFLDAWYYSDKYWRLKNMEYYVI